jgi:hypothetical protein
MFPFKIRYSTKIEGVATPDLIQAMLDVSRDLLREYGADFFSRESNRITFENRFFKLTSNWNLMVAADAGFVEISNSEENKIKVRYGFTLTRILVLSFLISIIILIVSREIYFSIFAFFVLGFLIWLIAIARHRYVLTMIVDRIEHRVLKINKLRTNGGGPRR